nr:hypothetical protein CFP56_10167 [Quercus suber]
MLFHLRTLVTLEVSSILPDRTDSIIASSSSHLTISYDKWNSRLPRHAQLVHSFANNFRSCSMKMKSIEAVLNWKLARHLVPTDAARVAVEKAFSTMTWRTNTRREARPCECVAHTSRNEAMIHSYSSISNDVQPVRSYSVGRSFRKYRSS